MLNAGHFLSAEWLGFRHVVTTLSIHHIMGLILGLVKLQSRYFLFNFTMSEINHVCVINQVIIMECVIHKLLDFSFNVWVVDWFEFKFKFKWVPCDQFKSRGGLFFFQGYFLYICLLINTECVHFIFTTFIEVIWNKYSKHKCVYHNVMLFYATNLDLYVQVTVLILNVVYFMDMFWVVFLLTDLVFTHIYFILSTVNLGSLKD